MWLLALLLFSAQSRFAAGSATLIDAYQTPVYLPVISGQLDSTRPPSDTVSQMSNWSSPIVVSPKDDSIWAVNPDSDSISIFRQETPGSLRKIRELPVGRSPWSVAISPDGAKAYVVNRSDGALTVIDAATLSSTATIYLGAEPSAIVLDPQGRTAYVALTAEAAVIAVELANPLEHKRIAVAPMPYALAVTSTGQNTDEGGKSDLYVTHLASVPSNSGENHVFGNREGVITQIDTQRNEVSATVHLAANVQGFPSRMTGITISGNRAWVAHVRTSPDLPNGLTDMVFAAISTIDLNTLEEDIDSYLPLNDQDIFGSPVNNPQIAVPSPNGDRLYVALAGSNLIEVIDISNPERPDLLPFIATGANPLGMAISRGETYAYVLNYLSRSITVLDLETLQSIDEVSSTEETLDPEILRGKVLFNDGVDSRISSGGWFSCASCHFDGWPDGITWHFPDGPRQTPMLWNAGATLPWHWSAALDEPQDVEETILTIQQGTGLLPEYAPSSLGIPRASRSADLDALALYVTNGIRAPALGQPENDTAQLIAAGRELFTLHGCASCHGGAAWTSSALPGPAGALDSDQNGMIDSVLHDVGTVNTLDERGATGFDAPSLLLIQLTPPYLHDGSAPTLESLLRSGHPNPASGGGDLTDDDIETLSTFLRSIDNTSAPIESE